jgi:site-specific recombinase XerC
MPELDLKARRAKVLGKGSKERYVYFDPITVRCLNSYLRVRPESTSTNVFLNRSGDPYRRGALQRLLERFGEEAGIPFHVTPHCCRHFFATQFARLHPGELFQLQELLGHSDLSMSRKYTRLADAQRSVDGVSVVESLNISKLVR